MKKYKYNGEDYYFSGSKWLDSHYLSVPTSLLPKLNALLAEGIDFDNMIEDELLDFAAKNKEGENYQVSIKVFERLMKSDKPDVCRNILPRLLSCYRKVGKQDLAIETGESYIQKYGNRVASPALYTTLGAAYCDNDNYAVARKYANKAMGMSGGKASVELISLYGRIKSNDGGVEYNPDEAY